MNKLKLISAAVIVSASIVGPAFAQDMGMDGPYVRAAPYAGPASRPQTYYRSYGQVSPEYYAPRNDDEYRNLQNFGFSGRDPSRVGGQSPDLNPSGS
jgi:hypothetical protein